MTACALAACALVDLSGYSSGKPIGSDAGPAADASAPPPDGGGGGGGGGDGAGLPDAGPGEHPYVAAVRADAPVSWYRFEEDADANVAHDEVGGRDAPVVGGSMGFGATGVVGRGLACDGTGMGFDLGDVYDFDGTVPFTFELWIHATPAAGDRMLVHKRKSDNPMLGYILYVTDDETVKFEDWGVDLSAWTDSPLPSSFTHVVLTVAYENGKGNAKLWINAQPQPNGGFDNTASTANTNQPLRLLEGFKGLVDELAIYDKALGAATIYDHYQAGKP